MKEMTETEAEYWDDYYTNNTVMPDLSTPGFFSRKYGMRVQLDPEAVHKTPAEISGDMVREKIAAAL